jgi:hypothetical protein
MQGSVLLPLAGAASAVTGTFAELRGRAGFTQGKEQSRARDANKGVADGRRSSVSSALEKSGKQLVPESRRALAGGSERVHVCRDNGSVALCGRT